MINSKCIAYEYRTWGEILVSEGYLFIKWFWQEYFQFKKVVSLGKITETQTFPITNIHINILIEFVHLTHIYRSCEVIRSDNIFLALITNDSTATELRIPHIPSPLKVEHQSVTNHSRQFSAVKFHCGVYYNEVIPNGNNDHAWLHHHHCIFHTHHPH